MRGDTLRYWISLFEEKNDGFYILEKYEYKR